MVEAIIELSIAGAAVLFSLIGGLFGGGNETSRTTQPDTPGNKDQEINQHVPENNDTSNNGGVIVIPKGDSGNSGSGGGSGVKVETKENEPKIIVNPQPTPSSKPQTPPPRVVPEEEKFLMGLLPVLYSGDKAAIRKNLYIEGLEDNFIDMIIDNMNYSKTAEEHGGYASAKVNECKSESLDKKTLYRFDTTVTFKDKTTCNEAFKIVKDSSGTFKLYD